MSDDYEIKGSYSYASDHDLRNAHQWGGDAGAGHELAYRDRRDRDSAASWGATPRPPAAAPRSTSRGDGAFLLATLLLAPIGIAALVLQGLAAGVDRLTYDSPLASLFPVPGDGPTRFALSLVTLLLLIPGTLLWTSRRLRTTRLRPLGTWLLSPAAVLLVPVVVYVAVTTYTTDVVRLGG
ncbi:hypothetical protein ACFXA3_10515 [Streptomyces sp. NPDC059456]|uniref:hypothetical protein n=1 Tax=Streptomyces sp. NPDC059456 TaxID=3346838 RepID=UPI0036C104ED